MHLLFFIYQLLFPIQQPLTWWANKQSTNTPTTHPSIQKVGGWLVGWFAIHAKKSDTQSTHPATIAH
jgi:hypothetical protein